MLYTLQTTPWLYFLGVILLSLAVGSFLNVVIYRLPRMMEYTEKQYCQTLLQLPLESTPRYNLWWPLSHCRDCHHTLNFLYNIPLLSYLCLRGRCAYCHASISLRYPAVELLTCVLSVFIVFFFGPTLYAVAALLFTWCCIPMIFIDMDYQLLPDTLTLLLLWLGLAASLLHLFVTPDVAIIGAITGYALFWLFAYLFQWIMGKEGLGQGDFKLLSALGAWTGWMLLPLVVFIAAYLGSGAFRGLILAADPRLLTAIQAWRAGGLGFLALNAHGVLPGLFAWPAGLGDIAIGVTAPWVALALIRRPTFVASRQFVVWNLLGILDLVVAVSAGALSSGFVAGLVGEITTAPMAQLPLVLVPAYLVPLFIMLHLAALFQARRQASSMDSGELHRWATK